MNDSQSRPGNGNSEADQGRLEARSTADGSSTLYSCRYDQTYHSHHGAVAESKHVFVEGSGAGARLRAGDSVRVLEVGFGTGLNFLLTAQQALSTGASLSYVSLERLLLPAALLGSLGYRRFAPEAAGSLLEFRDRLPLDPPPGRYRAQVGGSSLELRLGEAKEAEIEPDSFDVVYHDAFSPDANPELWDDRFLARLARSLVPDGVLVSYTVKGEVRRRLAAAGLQVNKLPGPPGGKREMLWAARRTVE